MDESGGGQGEVHNVDNSVVFKSPKLTIENIKDYIGVPIYEHTNIRNKKTGLVNVSYPSGVVTGLAYNGVRLFHASVHSLIRIIFLCLLKPIKNSFVKYFDF